MESEPESLKEEKPRKSRRRSRYSRSTSRSSDSESDSSNNRRRRKKSKRKHRNHGNEDSIEKKEAKLNFRGETEEEYDARLEREENERLAADRKIQLERMKEKYDAESQTQDGVRFKGQIDTSSNPCRVRY